MKHTMKKLTAMMLLSGALTAQAQTQVNVAHLAPFADNEVGTAVSVEVNDAEVLNPVTYNQISGYLQLSGAGVAPGDTDLAVFAPPGAANPAIAGTLDLAADTSYTVAAVGNVSNRKSLQKYVTSCPFISLERYSANFSAFFSECATFPIFCSISFLVLLPTQ